MKLVGGRGKNIQKKKNYKQGWGENKFKKTEVGLGLNKGKKNQHVLTSLVNTWMKK